MKFLLLLLILTSCWTKEEKPSVVEESTQIVSDYVDTLEGSITDAKKVAEMINQRNAKINTK
jgi:hypothetical protein